MADWTLVPCLVSLRAEFNQIAPDRDKTSDGSIGDPAHAASVSDHNPDSRGLVHAIDVDVDLRTPGLSMELAVQHLLARCRSGAERRLKYVIYNRRIWSASQDWIQRAYTGSNPHDKHAHFSAVSTPSLEASTASWHLEDLVAITTAEINDIADAVWDKLHTSPYDGVARKAGDYLRFAPSRDGISNAVDVKLAPRFIALSSAVAVDESDEQAVIAGVLAGLDPEALAASISQQVIAALPDGVEVTPEQLLAAVLGALRELAAPQQP